MGKHKKSRTDSQAKRRCVLCDRTLFSSEQDYVIGATGRVVCRDCLNVSKRLFPEPQASSPTKKPLEKVFTPQDIIRELDKSIIGQERAKRAIAVALWKQQLRAAGDTTVPRMNLLLYGPTGCGKTVLVREASKIVGLPFVTFDATTLSETGYRGRDAEDLVKNLIDQFPAHPKLSSGVIFLDEFDKLTARGEATRTEYNRGTQHSLLKLVEGVDVKHGSTTLSSESLLFIFGGAFTGLTAYQRSVTKMRPIGFAKEPFIESSTDSSEISTDSFVSYGMEPELLGRVGQYVALEPLTSEELKRIFLESNLSMYLQYKKFFEAHGVVLEFSPKRIDELINEAMKRGTGARGLNNLIEAALEPLMFQLAVGNLSGLIRVESEMERYVG